MADLIRHKRSAVQGASPTTGDLELGEIAVNTYDGKLFMKKNDGSDAIVEVGAGATYSTASAVFTGDYWINGDSIFQYTVKYESATLGTGTISQSHSIPDWNQSSSILIESQQVAKLTKQQDASFDDFAGSFAMLNLRLDGDLLLRAHVQNGDIELLLNNTSGSAYDDVLVVVTIKYVK